MLKIALLILACAASTFSALAQSPLSPTAHKYGTARVAKQLPVRPPQVTVQGTTGTGVQSPDQSIIENLDRQEEYTRFVQSLERAAMVPLLQGAGPYTVLAPTNKAFDRLVGNGTLADLWLPANQQQLYELLAGHIIVGDLRAQNLTDGQRLTTLAGTQLQIRRRNGQLHFVDAQGRSAALVTADIVSRNGAVHVLNDVLGQ